MGEDGAASSWEATDPGRTGQNNRLFVEAVLWIVRTGARGAICRHSSANGTRCGHATEDGLKADFSFDFSRPGRDHDFEYALIDATIVKVHRHGPGAKGGLKIKPSESRGGLTTKIVALADALGNLVRFVLLPGQRLDSVGVEPFMDGLAFGALIGDKAFDSDWLRLQLNERGALVVIPPNAAAPRKSPTMRKCTNGVI